MANYTEMFTNEGERRLVGEMDVERFKSIGWTFEKQSKANKRKPMAKLDINKNKIEPIKKGRKSKAKKK